MAKMIQIRNVPEELHRTLKARAAKAGMSLSDYLMEEARRAAERPTLEELLDRIGTRPRPLFRRSSASVIRHHRDAS